MEDDASYLNYYSHYAWGKQVSDDIAIYNLKPETNNDINKILNMNSLDVEKEPIRSKSIHWKV